MKNFKFLLGVAIASACGMCAGIIIASKVLGNWEKMGLLYGIIIVFYINLKLNGNHKS